ncbi:MAG: M23 family metallopeptidase, partial [Spirochaetales bacterium]
NEPIGALKSEAVWYAVLEELDQDSAWFSGDPECTAFVSFETAEGKPLQPEAFKKNLVSFLKSRAKGWSIAMDRETAVTLDSREAADAAVQNIIRLYTPGYGNDDIILDMGVDIEENYEIIPGIFEKKSILGQDDAERFLLKGTLEEKDYTVVSKDTISSIAKKYGLTVKDICKANPRLNPDKIYPGDVINLIVPKPYLHVRADYTHIYNQKIPYYTEIIWDDTMYRTISRVERPGVSGRERITASEAALNGQLAERTIILRETLSLPVSCILRQGTLRTPEDILVASSILPEGLGKISSFFGPRWGTFHGGIDLGVDIGTPIFAYTTGTVTYAGYSSMFGYNIEIEHSEGLKTRYCHCSQLLMKNGDKVYGKQTIALSGNTGYSTGPHVHFEIQLNGRTTDPLVFLKNTVK